MTGVSNSPISEAVTEDLGACGQPVPLELESLTQRCMGNLALVERLLASFEQRFPVEVSELARCLEAGDARRLACNAHQLKGASANLSAPALRALFERVEHAARAEELAPIAGYLAELQAEWERFCRYRAGRSPVSGALAPTAKCISAAAKLSIGE